MHLLSVFIIPFFTFVFFVSSFSQPVGFDEIFVDNIKTVRFHVDGIELSSPMVELNSSTRLALSFDDMEDDGKRYYYKLTHCNKDWTPSNLSPLEYLDGFEESEIDNFNYSARTMNSYVNYQLLLPNNDVTWTKSGNYLLSVYNEENNELVFVRRFVVFESIVAVAPKMVRPSNVSKMRSHQEIDFSVDYSGFNIRNPRMEISASVLQNQRWDNAIMNVSPYLERLEELIFDYQDKIVFPGGNEFRFTDLRSVRFRGVGVVHVDRDENGYNLILAKDGKRQATSYLFSQDLNGNFVIQNTDFSNTSNGRSTIDSTLNGSGFDVQFGLNGLRNDDRSNFQSDYVNVLFSLASPTEYFDQSVYIIGKFTDWQIKPAYKMVYNNRINAYVSKQYLKQGYYDYLYALVDESSKKPEFILDETEGNRQETNNLYTILIYYSPFGARYDRIIGQVSFTSGL